MVRVRKLALAIAAASALSSGVAHALSLGEVTLRSALNQPLVAEIELLEARDIGSEELVPALASPEEFNKAGVDRQYFLSDLKFTPIIKPNGKSVIRVTSSKPVREPYLNFLVEVLWPSGRLLREYTLLLDPPLYSSQTAMSATQRPLAEQQTGAVPRAPAAAAIPPAPAPSRPAKPSTQPAAKVYKTTANDTLWKVAERVRTSGTVHQTMLAIQDLNPQAFLDGNINRLVRGQALRLPDEEQIRRRSENQALAEVAAQNAAWRGRRAQPAVAATRQLDATHRAEPDAAPARVETGDSLRLVAADNGKAVVGSDKGADGKASAEKLALAKENLDATQRENAELKSRMDDLQSQLDKLQRLITLKDEQLAKLQANLAQPEQSIEAIAKPAAAQPSTATPPVAASVTPAPASVGATVPSVGGSVPAAPSTAVPAAQSGGTASIQPAVVAETPAPPATGPVAAVPATQPEVTVPVQPAAVAEIPASPAAESVAAVPAAQSIPTSQPQPEPAKPVVPKPVRSVTAAEQPIGLVDSILDSPLLLPSLGGGAAATLLLGLLVARRRAAKKTDLVENDEGEMVMADTRLDTGLSRMAVESPLLEDVPKVGQAQDVLDEAEDHIAYGRFNEAAALLEVACGAQPKRSDLRLKLMEAYAELGDREGFARQEKLLRESAGAQPQVDHLKMKYPSMAGFAIAALAGTGLAVGLAAPEEEEAPPTPAHEPESGVPVFAADINLSLDDLEAELERDLQGAGQGNASLSLDDLTLDEALQSVPPGAKSLVEDFSFDLELPEEVSGPELEKDLKELALDLETPVGLDAFEDKDFLGLGWESLDASAAAPAKTTVSEDALLEDGLFDSFDLAAESSFSDDADLAAPTFELPVADKIQEAAPGLMAQLDDLDVELEQLAAGLGEPNGATQPVAHSLGELVEGEDFDFLADADEIATKLDLARAYIDMGDTEGAQDILDEVLQEGSETQRQEAHEISARLV